MVRRCASSQETFCPLWWCTSHRLPEAGAGREAAAPRFEEAFGMGDVSAAAAALLQGATIDRASAILSSRCCGKTRGKRNCLVKLSRQCLSAAKMLLEPKLGPQPLYALKCCPPSL
jgi:hypothetical protein